MELAHNRGLVKMFQMQLDQTSKALNLNNPFRGLPFPGGAVVENLPTNAGDTGSRPGLGRSHMPQRN